MSKRQALQEFQSELHISHSQIFTYLNCSLKYFFQYVRHMPPERISINLPFGSAIHSAIELYYRALKNKGQTEPLKAVIGRFEDCLNFDLDHTGVPVIYKKDMPDKGDDLTVDPFFIGGAMGFAFEEGFEEGRRKRLLKEQSKRRKRKKFSDDDDSD